MYISISRSLYVYGRTLNIIRNSNNIKYIARGSRKFAKQQNVSNESTTFSKKFPDYRIIYTFPHMNFATRLVFIKKIQTGLTATTIPILLGLQMFGVQFNPWTIIIPGIAGLVWIHAISFITYNAIGTIYYKKDDESVILSYLTYWGKRVDLKTSIDNITPLSETPRNTASFLYRILHIKPNQKLKLNLAYGRVYEKNEFNYICGTYMY